jgi:hypothetical protein
MMTDHLEELVVGESGERLSKQAAQNIDMETIFQKTK